MVSPDRAQQANEYMKEKMFFTPRMFQIINTVAPEAGGTLRRLLQRPLAGRGPWRASTRSLCSLPLAWPTARPHVSSTSSPAIEAGATDGEIFEAVSVGMIAAGFVPNGPGIPLRVPVRPQGAGGCRKVPQGRVLGVHRGPPSSRCSPPQQRRRPSPETGRPNADCSLSDGRAETCVACWWTARRSTPLVPHAPGPPRPLPVRAVPALLSQPPDLGPLLPPR